MTDRVCIVNGTSGINRDGSESGNAPSSSTEGTSQPNAVTSTVKPTIATSGEGIAVVSRGNSTMIAKPVATRG